MTLSWTSSVPVGAVVGGSYTAIATSTNGAVPVLYSIDSGPCSVNSGTGLVSFTGVGTCVVDANQAGDATHSAAAQIQQSFAIGLATATCTITPYNVPFDGIAHSATGFCTPVVAAAPNGAAPALQQSLTGLDLSGTTHTAVGDYAEDPGHSPSPTTPARTAPFTT